MPTSRPDVFLSYSREDQATARRFAEALEGEGFNVWWDQTLHSGEAYDKVTENALREARAVVLLWSKASVESRWVRAEATTADRLGTLVPVMIESCNRPIMFELTHTTDLSNWKGDRNEPAWRAYADDVRRVMGQAAPPPSPMPSSAPAAVETRRGMAAWLPGAAIAILAALLLGGGWLWMQQRGKTEGPDVAAKAVVPAGPVTLAVLPFADLSSGQDQEYFSDGLTEEILNRLAQVPEMRVTGRTSSFSFKGKNEDLRGIASQLGVAHLLEGSIRKDGNTLRITAQLIDGRDGAHLWSKTYDRELSSVFTLQDEVAQDVARALSIRLDVGAMSRAQGGTTNVDAYDRYLRARTLFLEGGLEAALQAARLLREAVSLDPQFARAWLGLSQATSLAAIRLPEDEAARLRSESREANARVLALAPEGLTAQTTQVRELLRQGKWAEAEALTDKLFRSTPMTAENMLELAGSTGVYFLTGRMQDVIRFARQAQQLEPLSQIISTDLQRFLFVAGDYEAAELENERSKGLPGDWSRPRGRALLLELRKEPINAQVVRELAAPRTSDEGLILPAFAQLAEAGGDRKAMQAIVRKEFADPANQGNLRTILIYQLADALGDRDLALAALERLTLSDNPDFGVVWLAPVSGVRADPRFKAILRNSGVVDYFRSKGNWGDFCKPVGDDDFECQ